VPTKAISPSDISGSVIDISGVPVFGSGIVSSDASSLVLGFSSTTLVIFSVLVLTSLT